LIFNILFFNLYSQNNIADIEYHQGFDKNLFPFFHGVASGDATNNAVIIWTRVTPERKMRSIDVLWTVATDSLMKNIVQSGKFRTLPERDYTVKIDVQNLKPNKVYFYQFTAFNKKSPIGRTKTLPADYQKDNDYNAVFFTGSNFNAGYFNAYKIIAQRNDIDAVFHLGDYFYEYGTNTYGDNPHRTLMPDYEVITLQDYRTRLSHYRLDPDLREAHRKFCWYIIWDDHESANNSWKNGAENHQPNEGSWKERLANAQKAYFEWMPIREKQDSEIYDIYSVAKLARFITLDTRIIGRDNQNINPYDTNKTMLGQKQLNWLFDQLLKAKKDSVKWIFITQQVMFAPLMIKDKIFNTDQWDGYQFERQKIIDFIRKNNLKNVVIISGDIHSSWANEIYADEKHNFIIPEFITPSVTSPFIGKLKAFGYKIFAKPKMKYIKYVDLTHRGFMILRISDNQIVAEWDYLNTVKKPSTKIFKTVKYFIQKPQPLIIKKLKQ